MEFLRLRRHADGHLRASGPTVMTTGHFGRPDAVVIYGANWLSNYREL